jgi:cytochrome b561
MTENSTRYSRVAVVLHWAIAILIILNLIIGSRMESLPLQIRGNVVRVHESFGFSIFVLALLRVAWRCSHPPPGFPAHFRLWERGAARCAHVVLYVLMIAMPVVGWLIISANLRRPMVIFGTWILPPFAPLNALPAGAHKTLLHDEFVTIHAIGAWSLLVLLILHVSGALKHQFVDGDDELRRMWFAKRESHEEKSTFSSDGP